MKSMREKVRRNIKIYYYYAIFSNLLWGPILVIYFQAKGLSFTEIMLLQSVSSIGVVLFEVPTGALGDRIGRKLSVIIGSSFWGISLIMYIFSKSFFVFMLAEIIFSIGTSFKSGSDTALIYDSLKILKNEEEFQKIEGKAKAYSFYVQALGGISIGFLYKINIELPIIISAILMGLTVIVSIMFIEPSIEFEDNNNKSETYIRQIIDSGKYIVSNREVKAITLYSMVFYLFFRGGYYFYQPYFEVVDIPVEYFGIIFFIFNIVAGITSKNCYKIMQKTKEKTLLFISFLMIVSFFILGVTKVWIGFLAILPQQMARALYFPVTRKYLNKNIPSNKRATILSFSNLLINLVVAIIYPLFGILKDSTNIFTTHIITALSMIILTCISFIAMHKILKGKSFDVSNSNKIDIN